MKLIRHKAPTRSPWSQLSVSDQALLVAPGPVVPAARAAKARGPARPHQVPPALRVGPEALQEGRQIARQILQQLIAHSRPPHCVPTSFTLPCLAAGVKQPEPCGELDHAPSSGEATVAMELKEIDRRDRRWF